MDLSQQHDDIAWGHWLSQFRSRPRLEALVRSLVTPMNGLQIALRQLHDDRWLDTAVGAQLDGIGTIVEMSRSNSLAAYRRFFGTESKPAAGSPGIVPIGGVASPFDGNRADFSDEEYAQMLRWKIAINNGHGTRPEIIAALKVIFGASRVILQNVGNAKIRVWMDISPIEVRASGVNVRAFVPKAAGVGLKSITGGSPRPFGFRNQGFFGFGVGVLSRSF